MLFSPIFSIEKEEKKVCVSLAVSFFCGLCAMHITYIQTTQAVAGNWTKHRQTNMHVFAAENVFKQEKNSNEQRKGRTIKSFSKRNEYTGKKPNQHGNVRCQVTGERRFICTFKVG